MPTNSYRTPPTTHRTSSHTYMPRSKTANGWRSYDNPQRPKSPSPVFEDDSGPWQQTVNTYIWAEQQAEAQRQYMRHHGFTVEACVVDPDWTHDKASRVAGKARNEKASFIDIQARAWMLQEEARRIKAQREAERTKAAQEEMRRAHARIRFAREMERQRIAEERRRAYNNWKAYDQRVREETNVSLAWERYQGRWANITSSSEPLTFRTIPWPMMRAPASPESITADAISAFLLSPAHSSSQTPKERIKEALKKWHPDRFSRLLKRVADDDREKVDQAAGIVTRCLNELLSRQYSQSRPVSDPPFHIISI